jgi:hypothetical protein
MNRQKDEERRGTYEVTFGEAIFAVLFVDKLLVVRVGSIIEQYQETLKRGALFQFIGFSKLDNKSYACKSAFGKAG